MVPADDQKLEGFISSLPMGDADAHADARRSQLIPLLQRVQERYGFLPRRSMELIAVRANLTSSKVYGVATFYNQFRFEAPGRYLIQVCRGTACHVKGSQALLETIERELKVSAGRTTHDGLFSLEVVTCIGACGLSPVIAINGTFHAAVTPEKARTLLRNIQKEADHGRAA